MLLDPVPMILCRGAQVVDTLDHWFEGSSSPCSFLDSDFLVKWGPAWLNALLHTPVELIHIAQSPRPMC